MYSVLILVWPVVWAGDRFLLPLYPLVFFYGAVAIRGLNRRLSPAVTSLVGVLVPGVASSAANWPAQIKKAGFASLLEERSVGMLRSEGRIFRGGGQLELGWSSRLVSALTRSSALLSLSGHSAGRSPRWRPRGHLRLADAVERGTYYLISGMDRLRVTLEPR